jgi:putative endonuclease
VEIKGLLPASRSNLNLAKTKKKVNLGFMKPMGGWVYIMCSINHPTLYVGVTSNIASRVYEHKHKTYPKSFTSKYNCFKIVYYRRFELIIEAIAEEKRIKGGSRRKKVELINTMNPEWKDLYDEVKYL